MSPATFLALATFGSLAFTFTVGFLVGHAWATWRGRSLAARISKPPFGSSEEGGAP